jgi:hypothetical protein
MLRNVTRLPGAALDMFRRAGVADRAVVKRRIASLVRASRGRPRDELHRDLVLAKCLQVGAIGAVSGLVGALPLIGRPIAGLLGPVADAALVSTLQAELILETFALYEVDLPPQAEKLALLGLLSAHAGAREVGASVARTVSRQAQRWLGGALARRALPLANIATGVATHVAVTWAVGTRARAMAKLREGDLADWPALLSDLTLIDQRRLGRWVAEAAETALERGNGMVRLWSTQMQEAMRPPLPPARKRAAPRRVSKPAAGSRPARARKSK